MQLVDHLRNVRVRSKNHSLVQLDALCEAHTWRQCHRRFTLETPLTEVQGPARPDILL
jgi:hypothetical protein